MGTICIELEKKSLEQRKDGYPFAKNSRKKSHDKSNQWVQHTNYKSYQQDQLLEEGLHTLEVTRTSLRIKLTMLITYFLEFLNFH